MEKLHVLGAKVGLAFEHVAEGVVYLLFVSLYLFLVLRDHLLEG